jgi:hypothetical protein
MHNTQATPSMNRANTIFAQFECLPNSPRAAEAQACAQRPKLQAKRIAGCTVRNIWYHSPSQPKILLRAVLVRFTVAQNSLGCHYKGRFIDRLNIICRRYIDPKAQAIDQAVISRMNYGIGEIWARIGQLPTLAGSTNSRYNEPDTRQ